MIHKYILFLFSFLFSTIIIPLLFFFLKCFERVFSIKFNWHLNSKILIYYFCGIKHYILSNHRCLFDGPFDSYISNSSIVARKEAVWANTIASLLGFYDKRIVSFSRGLTNRQELFQKIQSHLKVTSYKRILYYPEGTRLLYTELNSASDIKARLKVGLLKSIYQDKQDLPVQLCISSNKDIVFNEKKFIINYGTRVKTEFSSAIYPSEYDDFDKFINKICHDWFELWVNTHLE